MVVLEGGGMLTTGSNQYLQPDYLSPLPTTLDAKKSPLALLAQTCSQIGADSPPSKPLIASLEKSKKGSSASSNSSASSAAAPPAAAADTSPAPDVKNAALPAAEKTAQRASPAEPRLAFKPYEANVLTKKVPDERPASSKSGAGTDDDRKPSSRTPSRKSASPAAAPAAPAAPPAPVAPTADTKAERGKSVSPGGGTSPIIRSGLEILQGHPKDVPLGTYKGPLSTGLGGVLGSSLGALCSGCPPGLESSNPAFRPPFAGAAGPFAHHHAAMLAASAYPGAAPGPYVSYARVKTAGGGEALVPVCKDPYCTGCQYSAAHQQLLLGAAAAAAAACPSGCTQCDHQKYAAAGLSLSGLVPPGPVAPPPPLSYTHQLGRPYVCNWIAGDSYCGKRFASSDELLQHLRTHTSLGAAADSAAAAAAAAAAASSAAAAGSMSSLLNPHSFLSTGLHRAGYPNPPLSPLSAAARYHPYSKPGGALPPSLAASPFSAFNPTALGPYYSPYSLYGQRMGAAAVHP